MLIVLGGEIFEGRYFYIWYDGIVQKFKRFIEALDFCFKLTRILNIKYSEDCLQLWTFFQVYFYKITTPNDVSITTVENFITKLK